MCSIWCHFPEYSKIYIGNPSCWFGGQWSDMFWKIHNYCNGQQWHSSSIWEVFGKCTIRKQFRSLNSKGDLKREIFSLKELTWGKFELDKWHTAHLLTCSLHVFSFQNTVSVPENKVNALVVKMPVSDGDEPHSSNWATKYRIVDGDPGGMFTVNPGPSRLEGIITTAKVPAWFLGFFVQMSMWMEPSYSTYVFDCGLNFTVEPYKYLTKLLMFLSLCHEPGCVSFPFSPLTLRRIIATPCWWLWRMRSHLPHPCPPPQSRWMWRIGMMPLSLAQWKRLFLYLNTCQWTAMSY